MSEPNASAHCELRSNEEYCLNSPARREAEKWLISVGLLVGVTQRLLPRRQARRQRGLNSRPRRALKSSHFLASKTDSDSGFIALSFILAIASGCSFRYVLAASVPWPIFSPSSVK